MLSAAYAPDGGGVATHVTELVQGLATLQVHSSVFTLNRPNEKTNAEPGLFAHITKQQRKQVPAYDGRRVFAEEMIIDIGKKWRRMKADLVHCHDFDSLFVGWLLKAGCEKTLPLVLTQHRAPNPWHQERRWQDAKDLFLWTAICSQLNGTSVIDTIVVPSHASKDVIEASLVEMVKAKKITAGPQIKVIQHGISDKLSEFPEHPDLLANLGCTESKILVFCPSRNDENKDVSVFIDAAGLLKKSFKQNYPGKELFFLVADEDENGELCSRAKKTDQLFVGVDIAFRNFEYSEMATIYRRAKVCVVPSRLESFGLAVLEAFLMGVPVVASNTTGLKEIVKNGENGLLFSPGKSRDLAGRIEALLEDDEYCLTIIQKAKNQLILEGEFSRERMSRDYKNLYGQLIFNRPSDPSHAVASETSLGELLKARFQQEQNRK
jgi:glycosyltransferase involved in cell wall biosynthesis